jgi:hypothetical protein
VSTTPQALVRTQHLDTRRIQENAFAALIHAVEHALDAGLTLYGILQALSAAQEQHRKRTRREVH